MFKCKMTTTANSLYTWDTEYTADSAEFCPIENYEKVLAVGTYQLVNQESGESSSELHKKRVGKLYLKKLLQDGKLMLCQTYNISAILDMKWCHQFIDNYPVLAVATSVGEILLYKLIKDQNSFKFEIFSQIIIGDCLALSLDWSNCKLKSDNPNIVVSDSNGKIHIISLQQDTLKIVHSFKAHDFEAWISAYNYWNPNLIYTGGDDSKFRGFDIRCSPESPVFVNKSHMSGVTSIQSSIHHEHYIANGSYDEIVNIWDNRKMKTSLATINVGGGVWRVKWEPFGKLFLLTACMHNGFHVIDVQNVDNSKLELYTSFLDHESLAYGCDWCYDINEKYLVASASFYDHLLCVWDFNKN